MDRQVLKKYLGRYYNAKKRHEQLLERSHSKEMVSGVSYSAMPKQKYPNGDSVQEKCILAQEQTIKKINESLRRTFEIRADITHILDYLDDDSSEKRILEYRYIDCFSWKKICDKEHLARSSANRYRDKGLTELLKAEEVIKKIEAYYHKKEVE